jgi:hypothetical protein
MQLVILTVSITDYHTLVEANEAIFIESNKVSQFAVSDTYTVSKQSYAGLCELGLQKFT